MTGFIRITNGFLIYLAILINIYSKNTMYRILKRFVPLADIWVAKLDDNDPEYSYATLQEAEAALITLQPQYPNNELKVSNQI